VTDERRLLVGVVVVIVVAVLALGALTATQAEFAPVSSKSVQDAFLAGVDVPMGPPEYRVTTSADGISADLVFSVRASRCIDLTSSAEGPVPYELTFTVRPKCSQPSAGFLATVADPPNVLPVEIAADVVVRSGALTVRCNEPRPDYATCRTSAEGLDGKAVVVAGPLTR
jgi:hypothetical protein